jgi:hypothetical protein
VTYPIFINPHTNNTGNNVTSNVNSGIINEIFITPIITSDNDNAPGGSGGSGGSGGGSTPPPIIPIGTYLLNAGHFTMTLYNAQGTALVDFLHSPDGTSVTDGDFTIATITSVQSMFIDTDNTIYFVEQPLTTDSYTGDTLIRKLVFTSPTTGNITTISALRPSGYELNATALREIGITVIGDYIYTSDLNYSTIWKTPKSGGPRVLFAGYPFYSYPLYDPNTLIKDNLGNLYCSNSIQNAINQVDSTGTIIQTFYGYNNSSNSDQLFAPIYNLTTDGVNLYTYSPDQALGNYGLIEQQLSSQYPLVLRPQNGTQPIPSLKPQPFIYSPTEEYFYLAGSNIASHFAYDIYTLLGTYFTTKFFTPPTASSDYYVGSILPLTSSQVAYSAPSGGGSGGGGSTPPSVPFTVTDTQPSTVTAPQGSTLVLDGTVSGTLDTTSATVQLYVDGILTSATVTWE